jgi:hypothetical protein
VLARPEQPDAVCISPIDVGGAKLAQFTRPHTGEQLNAPSRAVGWRNGKTASTVATETGCTGSVS